jgi:hypothetical protein
MVMATVGGAPVALRLVLYSRTHKGEGGGFFWEAVSIGSPPRQKAGVQCPPGIIGGISETLSKH